MCPTHGQTGKEVSLRRPTATVSPVGNPGAQVGRGTPNGARRAA